MVLQSMKKVNLKIVYGSAAMHVAVMLFELEKLCKCETSTIQREG